MYIEKRSGIKIDTQQKPQNTTSQHHKKDTKHQKNYQKTQNVETCY